MKAPKKPSFKKAPKLPKATANKQVWENYYKKLIEIEKFNEKLKTDYNKKVKEFEADKKFKEKIKTKAKSGLGAI